MLTSRGISNYQIAKELLIPQTTLGAYRRGDRAIGPKHQVALADYLNITVDELMGREKPTTDKGDELPDDFPEFVRLVSRMSPEQWKQVVNYAKFLLQTAKEAPDTQA